MKNKSSRISRYSPYKRCHVLNLSIENILQKLMYRQNRNTVRK